MNPSDFSEVLPKGLHPVQDIQAIGTASPSRTPLEVEGAGRGPVGVHAHIHTTDIHTFTPPYQEAASPGTRVPCCLAQGAAALLLGPPHEHGCPRATAH